MCVIAVSRSGYRQPLESELSAMWNHNPDGGGYMYARDGLVHVHKGFTTYADFIRSVRSERFGVADSVVYHFRISTQAKRPEMTHPFPLSSDRKHMEYLDYTCQIAIAHNGVIRMTSDPYETRYSDTALFVADYLSVLIRSRDDLTDPRFQRVIETIGGCSRFAIMDYTGDIVTIGHFTDSDGLLLSNTNHVPFSCSTGPFRYSYSG